MSDLSTVYDAQRAAIPPHLRSFFAKYAQSSRTLANGDRVMTPLFFWGDGVFGLNGSVSISQASSYLAKFARKPLLVPGPGGMMALAGIMSPSYAGSSVGPYRSFFFGLFVDDPGWDPAKPAPGFQFIQFYDSTQRSSAAGALWGLHKIHADVASQFTAQGCTASVALRSKTMARISWRPLVPRVDPPAGEKRFHNIPEDGSSAARILVVGADSTAPFRAGRDEFYCDAGTKLGRTISEFGFTPRFFSFTSKVHGVYFLPDSTP